LVIVQNTVYPCNPTKRTRESSLRAIQALSLLDLSFNFHLTFSKIFCVADCHTQLIFCHQFDLRFESQFDIKTLRFSVKLSVKQGIYNDATILAISSVKFMNLQTIARIESSSIAVINRSSKARLVLNVKIIVFEVCVSSFMRSNRRSSFTKRVTNAFYGIDNFCFLPKLV